MRRETRAEERKRLESIISDTNGSYRIMCDAHAQLVEREQEHVWEVAKLKQALYEIFMNTSDRKSHERAASVLGIRTVPRRKAKKTPRAKEIKKIW